MATKFRSSEKIKKKETKCPCWVAVRVFMIFSILSIKRYFYAEHLNSQSIRNTVWIYSCTSITINLFRLCDLKQRSTSRIQNAGDAMSTHQICRHQKDNFHWKFQLKRSKLEPPWLKTECKIEINLSRKILFSPLILNVSN